MAVYHYSHITGGVEMCRAGSTATCPYRAYLHSSNKEEVQKYADRENSRFYNLTEEQQKYFDSDLMMSSEPAYCLTTDTPNYKMRMNQNTLEYLGFDSITNQSIRDSYQAYLVPKNKLTIQSFLKSSNDHYDRIFSDLELAINDGTYEIAMSSSELRKNGTTRYKPLGVGEPYDSFALYPYLQHSKETGTMQMDKKIKLKGPDGRVGYSLTDCWRDWCVVKKYKGEMWEIEKGKNNFVLFTTQN